ncbi:hypothetical protein [Planococcus halotolerans]|uniref:hypothetical protein n=1 Tax=Planococcus halotolerans TaxID=2233542 RepID=UPI001092E1F8|nr:hypothetical protein [Planococcus halotolerans]QHJ69794.1 hypothetical protein DNR44_003895 [Planococcus halotolerans]
MFDIEGKDISELTDTDLRALVGLLCEAELRSMNLPTAGVTWGGHQNAKDGGIDVRVELTTSVHDDGFIPRSNTGYQVKKPDMARSAIYKEMSENQELKETIKNLVDLNGAYIIVSSQGSTADSSLIDRRKAMQEVVNQYSSTSNIKLDFYDRERVAAWVRSYPAVGIWVRGKIGKPIQGWKTIDNWARCPNGIKEEYILDENTRLYSNGTSRLEGVSTFEGINKLRSLLSEPKSNIRLVGLSGVGKTRFVQAIFDDRIGGNSVNTSNIFYTDISDGPNPDPINLAERLENFNAPAIIIVDNCPPDLHSRLIEVGKKPGSLLSIITVEYDVRDDQPEETEVFHLMSGSKNSIERILKMRFTSLSEVNTRTIAEFSGGNARIAIALANTVKRAEDLSELRDEVLFKRLFEQRNEPDSNLLKTAEVCSLVYSFDNTIDELENNELDVIGSLIKIPSQEIYTNISELMRRELVQKRNNWRAVLPHAIANKLAQRALENIPIKLLCNNFESEKNERLLKSFSKRLSFLHKSNEAEEISIRWLSEGGILGNISNLNKLGMDILENITPVNQELVLTSIEKVLLSEEADVFFSRENPKYPEFTNLLCSISYEPLYFERAVSLLCRFALDEKENENYNSIRMKLKALFHLYLSGTKATPEQRLEVINKLVSSNINDERNLGLVLLESSLKTSNFMSGQNFEFGAHSRDYGFVPSKLEDFQHWYKTFIQYSLKLILSDMPIAVKAKDILGKRFQSLWLKTGLYKELENCAIKISEKGFWGEAWVAVKSLQNHTEEFVEPHILSSLDKLENLLKPKTLNERLELYVLSENPLSLMQTFTETENNGYVQLEENLKILGKEVGANYTTLCEVLPRVLQANNYFTYNFGQGLVEGSLDSKLVWEKITENLVVLEKSIIKYQVIEGFLSALSKTDACLCDELLDLALTKKVTAEVFPMLQLSVVINKRGLKRLFESLVQNMSSIEQYSSLAYGGRLDAINDSDFYKLVKLISLQPKGLEVAFTILHTRIHDRKKKGEVSNVIIKLGQELLSMFQVYPLNKDIERIDHILSEIIEASYTAKVSKDDAKVLCEKIVKGLEDFNVSLSDYDLMLKALAVTQPEVFLETILETNKSGVPVNIYNLYGLNSINNPISSIRDEDIIQWCEINSTSRYLLIANSIKPYYICKKDNEYKWTSLALQIINKCNNSLGVLSFFQRSLIPWSWSGSRAAEMERRLPLIYSLKSHHIKLVSDWASEQQLVHENKIRKEFDKELAEEKAINERFE